MRISWGTYANTGGWTPPLLIQRSFQLMLILLVQGPHFENHCSGKQKTREGVTTSGSYLADRSLKTQGLNVIRESEFGHHQCI